MDIEFFKNLVDELSESQDTFLDMFSNIEGRVSQHDFKVMIEKIKAENKEIDESKDLILKTFEEGVSFEETWRYLLYKISEWLYSFGMIEYSLRITLQLNHYNFLRNFRNRALELDINDTQEFKVLYEIAKNPEIFENLRKVYLSQLFEINFLKKIAINLNEITTHEFTKLFYQEANDDVDIIKALSSENAQHEKRMLENMLHQITSNEVFPVYKEYLQNLNGIAMKTFRAFCNDSTKLWFDVLIKPNLFISQYLVKKRTFEKNDKGWEEFLDFAEKLEPYVIRDLYLMKNELINDSIKKNIETLLMFHIDMMNEVETSDDLELRHKKPQIANAIRLKQKEIVEFLNSKSITVEYLKIFNKVYSDFSKQFENDILNIVNKIKENFGDDFSSNAWKSFRRGGNGRRIGRLVGGPLFAIIGGTIEAEVKENAIRKEIFRDFETLVMTFNNYLDSLSKFEEKLLLFYQTYAQNLIEKIVIPFTEQIFLKYGFMRYGGPQEYSKYMNDYINGFKEASATKEISPMAEKQFREIMKEEAYISKKVSEYLNQ